MNGVDPIFSFTGELLNCEACPWHENGCPRFKCPNKGTYKEACAAAMREVSA